MSSVRYSALSMAENKDNSDQFESIFTYADYNDLNNMGYKQLGRHRRDGGHRYSKSAFSTRARHIDAINTSHGVFELAFIVICYLLFAITLPLSLIISLKYVQSFEKMIVFRLGRAEKPKGSGIVVVLPCIDTYKVVDLRTKAFNVPPLQAVTSDKGLVEFGAIVYYRILDALLALMSVQDWNHSTRTLAQTMLHRHVNKETVCDMLDINRKKLVAGNVQGELGQITSAWGIEITKLELSQIKVVKEGESMVMEVLHTMVKSGVGRRIWESIYPGKTETTTGQNCTSHESNDSTLMDQVITDQESGSKIDLDKMIATLNSVLTPELMLAVDATYQVHCSDLGSFYLNLRPDDGHISPGTCPPQCPAVSATFTLKCTDLVRILTGRLDPLHAYMNGTVTVEGNLKSAVRIRVLGVHMARHFQR